MIKARATSYRFPYLHLFRFNFWWKKIGKIIIVTLILQKVFFLVNEDILKIVVTRVKWHIIYVINLLNKKKTQIKTVKGSLEKWEEKKLE